MLDPECLCHSPEGRKLTTEQQNPKPDTTMWTSLLHAGLAGSFEAAPCGPRRQGARRARCRAAIYGILGLHVDQPDGSQYGPRGIREISGQFLTYNATWDFDRSRRSTRSTAATATWSWPTPRRPSREPSRYRADLNAGALPATLGGDHSVTIRPYERWPSTRRPRGGAHRHASGYGRARGRRGAQPLLPDHPRHRRRFRPQEDALLAISVG